MFILTNISVEKSSATIFDTKDGVNETVSLKTVAEAVISGKQKVYGIEPLSARGRKDAIPIPNLGIFVSPEEAKKALSKYFQSKGLSKSEADRKAGLT